MNLSLSKRVKVLHLLDLSSKIAYTRLEIIAINYVEGNIDILVETMLFIFRRIYFLTKNFNMVRARLCMAVCVNFRSSIGSINFPSHDLFFLYIFLFGIVGILHSVGYLQGYVLGYRS